MSEAEQSADEEVWSAPVRVGFRLMFVYLFLYIFLNGEVVWDLFVPPMAEALGLELVFRPNGSGDTTYAYLVLLMMGVVTPIAAGLWSALDRERQAYPRLAHWCEVVVRYYVGGLMISYGLAKLTLLQFPPLDLVDMLQSYGNSSPMGLVWRFMGFSPAYEIIAGGLECVGGLLLLWRRTTTLGALIVVAVMGNVVLLNFCFDVPVKLASTHYLVMAAGLAVRDGRLVSILLLNRGVEPIVYAPHFESRRWHVAGRVVKALIVLGMVAWDGLSDLAYKRSLAEEPRSPLYGIYEVEVLREDGVERPGLVSDHERWRYLVFERETRMTVQRIDGSFAPYAVDIDEVEGSLSLTFSPRVWPDRFYFAGEPPTPTPEQPTYMWSFTLGGGGVLELAGELDGVAMEIVASPQPMAFELRERGFNWINETPWRR